MFNCHIMDFLFLKVFKSLEKMLNIRNFYWIFCNKNPIMWPILKCSLSSRSSHFFKTENVALLYQFHELFRAKLVLRPFCGLISTLLYALMDLAEFRRSIKMSECLEILLLVCFFGFVLLWIRHRLSLYFEHMVTALRNTTMKIWIH